MPHTPMPHIHRCHMCCLRNSCLNFIEVCNFTVVKRRCRSAPLSGEIHFQCKYRQAAPLGRQPPTSSLSGGHQRLAMRNRKSLTQTRQQCDQHWTSLCRSPTAQTAMSWLSGATVNFLLQIRSFECCTFLAIAVSICNCCFFFKILCMLWCAIAGITIAFGQTYANAMPAWVRLSRQRLCMFFCICGFWRRNESMSVFLVHICCCHL